MRRKRAYRSSGLLRSLTLLRTFLIASAVILAAGAVALSSTLSADLRTAALKDSAHDITAFTDAVLAPSLVRGNRVVATPASLTRLGRTVRIPESFRGVNVYARNGRLVFSTTQPGRVGRKRTSPDLRAAIETGMPHAEFVDPGGKAPPVVKVWAPLTNEKGRIVGATEISLDDEVVRETVAGSRWTIWYAVGIVFGVLWLVLAFLVRSASHRLRAQNEDLEFRSRDLLESSRELEATLLETIETLNAAVEARDPYTAGHAQRVRRVALAIGRELRLPAKQLGALGTAALFHDVGKIGMPDSILTKPDKLDPCGGGDHARARDARRRDRLANLLARGLCAGDPPPSRAVGRARLPGSPAWHGRPDRGRDHRHRRLLGCDDHRPTVRNRARHARRAASDPGGPGQAVQPCGGGRVPLGFAPASGGDRSARPGSPLSRLRPSSRTGTRDRCRPSRP